VHATLRSASCVFAASLLGCLEVVEQARFLASEVGKKGLRGGGHKVPPLEARNLGFCKAKNRACSATYRDVLQKPNMLAHPFTLRSCGFAGGDIKYPPAMTLPKKLASWRSVASEVVSGTPPGTPGGYSITHTHFSQRPLVRVQYQSPWL
jgi:hypothetical protein